MPEAHPVLPSVAPDPQVQHLGERIHHRHAHAVKAPGDLVGIAVELPAGMQLGLDDLRRRDALLPVDLCGNAAAVVPHGHRTVHVQGHRNRVAVAGQRLVYGVVDDLVDHVVQAGAVVGVADIHAGALAHGLEASQHLDRIGAVLVGTAFRGRVFAHDGSMRDGTRTPASTRKCRARPARGAKIEESVPVSQA